MTKKHRHILILGGTGFVGSYLCARLDRADCRVTVLTRLDAQRDDLWVLPNVRVEQTDPYDVDKLAAHMEGHDAVINLVGVLNPGGRKGAGFRRAHVELTDTVLRACRKAEVRRYLHMSALGIDDERSYYQKTKATAERVALNAGRRGMQVTVFKPSVIFGRGDGFLNLFAGVLRTFLVVPLACPKARLAPVFIGNVVDAFMRCLNDPASFGRSYSLCGPEVYTLKEIVTYTGKVMGLKRWVFGLPNWASRLQGAVGNFIPGKPFTTDNYKTLQTDNVCDTNGLETLGIQPVSLGSVVPGFLGGQAHQNRLSASRSFHGE